MKYMKLNILALLVGALALGGCKKYLDINKNPNIANNVPVELALPSAQVEIAHVLGNNIMVNGCFWAQYWTQSPLANQYKQYDQYAPSTDNYNRGWSTLYSGALADLQYVYNLAKSTNNKQYMAVAQLMTAYTFQVITDAWGDVPYTEALLGLESNGGIVSPKYDKQSAIYDSLINQIDMAIALIDPDAEIHPAGDDLVYGGDMSLWAKFAYTLKLKVALRMSEVNPVKSQAIVDSIYNDPNHAFIDMGEDALVAFTTAGGSQNPLYSEIVGVGKTQNIYASKTCVDSMNSNSDPRVFVFYKPLSNGTVVGNTQGDYNNSTNASGKSIASYVVGAEAANENSANAPVRFISSAESFLLQAEVAARGWGGESDDESLFYSGIDASFDAYGISDATEIAFYKDSTYWGVYPVGGTMEEK
ncbi:MAG TPA: SusD/RagB family nutrient-binding outer membrane lipoprotein, partial [Chitinophagaceae bacterium]|nr:SusD/RagB family nutrient-binding outer membrane lipoprotein [Chitinophagaceae bacterium]